MNPINVFAKNDTFVSSYYPTGNYSDLDYLLVNMSLEDPYQYTASLMQFDLSPLINNIADIASIRLVLFVDSIDFDNMKLDILLNCQNYDYSKVTWNTKPSATEIIAPVSIDKGYLSKYVEIDITDRIKKYILSCNSTVIGFTLLMSNPLGGITFGSSRHFKAPFLQSIFINENSYINSTNTHNVNLNCPANNNNGIINNLDPIIFTKDTIMGADLYSFHSSSGYFTVHSPGSYLLKWSVFIKEVFDVNDLSFSILDHSGNTLSSISSSPKAPIELKGSILIKINKYNYKFTIINTSGGTLRIASNPALKVRIELVKI